MARFSGTPVDEAPVPKAPGMPAVTPRFGGTLVEEAPDQVPHGGINAWLPDGLREFADKADDYGTSLSKGMVGLGEAAVGLGNIVSGGGLGNLLEEQLGWDPAKRRQELEQDATPGYQAAQQAVRGATGFSETLRQLAENPSVIPHAIAEALPGMAMGGLVGRGVGAGAQLLGRSAGIAAPAIGEGVVGAGQQAEKIRQETGTLDLGGTAAAIGTGAATGLLGAAGAKLGRMFGIADIDSQLAGQRGAEVARGLVNRVLGGGGLESVEEMGQSSVEQLLGNIATGKPWAEGIGQAAAMGGVVGGAMGGAAGIRRPQAPGAPAVDQQAPAGPLADAQQAPATAGQPAPLSPLQPAPAAPGPDPLAPRVPSLEQAAPTAPGARPWAGSQDVAPLFRSMGMDQQQMTRSLDLLAPVEQDIETARRGVQSWEETGRLAALTGTTIEQLRKHRAGVLFNAEEQVAATRLLRDKTTRVLELGNQLSTGVATEIDQANFLQQLADLRTAQRAVMASRAELGRALNVMRADVTTMKEATRMLESVGGQQGAKAIADAITTAARVGGVEAANKLARRAGSDLFWTAYKSALLSSPDTHVVNMVSNLFTSALQVPTRALAGAIGTAKRIATGGRAGETRMGEAGYQLAGALEGVVNGARGAVESWRTGQDAFGIDANKFEGYRQDLPGQKVWGAPLRLLQSEDNFFKFLNDGMERYSIAYRMASKELAGQGPAAVHKRVQQIIADPPKELLQAGEDAALFATFNNSAGKVTQAVNNLRLSLPWGTGNLVVPFLRTPANLITYAVKHSPAAPVFKDVRADIAAGGARQESAYARMGIGSLLISLGALGVAGGTLTGGGPTGNEERRAWLAAGNQPYSVKVNGRWVEYSRVEPFASLVGIAADVASGAQDQAIGLSSMLGAIGRNFTSKTWLQGLSGVMQALTDPDRYAGSWINRSVATLAQPWTVLSHIGRYGDEFQRVPSRDSLLDQLRYRLPGETIGREGLPKKIDPWGAPIREADRQIGRAGPSRVTTPSDDPVRVEAGRLGWSPGAPPKQVTDKGVPHTYTAEQYQELSELVGQLVHKGADRLMRHPGWKMLGDDERRAELDKLNTKARSEVRLAMIPYVHHGKRAAIEQLRRRYNLETK